MADVEVFDHRTHLRNHSQHELTRTIRSLNRRRVRTLATMLNKRLKYHLGRSEIENYRMWRAADPTGTMPTEQHSPRIARSHSLSSA